MRLDLETFAQLTPTNRLLRCAFDHVCAWSAANGVGNLAISGDADHRRSGSEAGTSCSWGMPSLTRREAVVEHSHDRGTRSQELARTWSFTSNCNGCSAFARCPP